jgi:hypothetical protein
MHRGSVEELVETFYRELKEAAEWEEQNPGWREIRIPK